MDQSGFIWTPNMLTIIAFQVESSYLRPISDYWLVITKSCAHLFQGTACSFRSILCAFHSDFRLPMRSWMSSMRDIWKDSLGIFPCRKIDNGWCLANCSARFDIRHLGLLSWLRHGSWEHLASLLKVHILEWKWRTRRKHPWNLHC